MHEIRKDVVRDNWVITATEFVLKPRDVPVKKLSAGEGGPEPGYNPHCPFCEGNEAVTTDEITAFREAGSPPNKPGWTVRTILNKFSALDMSGALDMQKEGIFEHGNGFGQHEVIIETPLHGQDFHRLPLNRIEAVFKMMRRRYNDLARDERIKYIQIYKNRGLFAGASLEHSHSQIVALPMVPANKNVLSQYYQEHDHCLICEMVKAETIKQERIVYEGDKFIIICPYASRFPYESWIIPRQHTSHFGDINDDEIREIALLTKMIITAVIDGLKDPAYNMVINTAPVNVPHQEGYHWHLEINPRLLVNAGVEIATGYFINPAAPESAAALLKDLFTGQKEPGAE